MRSVAHLAPGPPTGAPQLLPFALLQEAPLEVAWCLMLFAMHDVAMAGDGWGPR